MPSRLYRTLVSTCVRECFWYHVKGTWHMFLVHHWPPSVHGKEFGARNSVSVHLFITLVEKHCAVALQQPGHLST